MPGKSFDGKVVAVNPLVDAAGRAIVIRCAGAQPGHDVASGHVRACAPHHQEQADAMVVPEQALVPQGTEQYVFKIVDNKAARVKWRPASGATARSR
jgi:membrane fusion protein (multidrug efflux system)